MPQVKYSPDWKLGLLAGGSLGLAFGAGATYGPTPFLPADGEVRRIVSVAGFAAAMVFIGVRNWIYLRAAKNSPGTPG